MATRESLKDKMAKTKAASDKLQQDKKAAEDDSKFDKVDAAIEKKDSPRKPTRRSKTAPNKPEHPVSLEKMTLNYTGAEKVMLDDLSVRCAITGTVLTKSEILRLGIHALKDMSDAQLKKAIPYLERLKRGKKA